MNSLHQIVWKRIVEITFGKKERRKMFSSVEIMFKLKENQKHFLNWKI